MLHPTALSHGLGHIIKQMAISKVGGAEKTNKINLRLNKFQVS
jgi:hypothetical protein